MVAGAVVDGAVADNAQIVKEAALVDADGVLLEEPVD